MPYSQSASNVLDPGHIYMRVSPKLRTCKSTFSIWSQLWCGRSVQKLHSLKGSQWVDSGHLKSLVMSKEAEPSCTDEQRQLRWGTGSESNGNIGNMIWIHRMIAGRYYQCYLPRLLSRFTIMHTYGSVPNAHITYGYISWKLTWSHVTLDWPQHGDMLKIIHTERSLLKQLRTSLGNACDDDKSMFTVNTILNTQYSHTVRRLCEW